VVPKFWNYVKGKRKCKHLPDLALAVLAIPVSTAPCERLFSEQAVIHTKFRNRLQTHKVRQIHVIRKGTRDRAAAMAQVNAKNGVKHHRIVMPTELNVVTRSASRNTPNRRTSPRRPLFATLSPTRTTPRSQIPVSVSHEAPPQVHLPSRFYSPLGTLRVQDEPDAEEYEEGEEELPDLVENEIDLWRDYFNDVFDEEMEEDFREYDGVNSHQNWNQSEEHFDNHSLMSAHETVSLDVDPTEPIEEPDTTPYPNGPQQHFPQLRLSGIRAWSVSLATLFDSISTSADFDEPTTLCITE
jgi:hypothetical protein